MKDFLDYLIKMARTALDDACHFLWEQFKNLLKSIWQNKWVRLGTYVASGLVLFVCAIFICTIFNLVGLNTYEEGWRAGKLTDFTVSNRISTFGLVPPGYLFPTGEGHILLGNDSSHSAVLNGKIISPSLFSTSYAIYQDSESLVSQSVSMHYRILIHTWFLNGKTNVRATNFEKLSPGGIPVGCGKRSGDWFAGDIGTTGGKVVEVAESGSPFTWKTYEVKIHTGGNEFQQMSVVNAQIYECALASLKTGENMKIYYSNRVFRDPITQATSYNLLGIERIQ